MQSAAYAPIAGNSAYVLSFSVYLIKTAHGQYQTVCRVSLSYGQELWNEGLFTGIQTFIERRIITAD